MDVQQLDLFTQSCNAVNDIISGLISGGILIGIGYGVWKKQLNHSKKLDIWIKALTELIIARNCIKHIMQFQKVESIHHGYKEQQKQFDKLESIQIEFGLYFGDGYKKNFQIINSSLCKLYEAELYLKSDIITGNESKEYYQNVLNECKNINDECYTIANINSSIKEIEGLYNSKKNKFVK